MRILNILYCIYSFIYSYIHFCFCCLVAKTCVTLCDPMKYSMPGSSVHGIFSGRNPGVSCHFLIQGILPTQGWNPHLLPWQEDSLPLSNEGSLHIQFNSVQSLSRVRLFATPWTAAHPAFLSIINIRGPPKPVSNKSVMPSYHLILCRPLLLLPSIFPSIRVFSNESALRIRWQEYWNFSFNISPSNEHPGLVSFRMNWLDLLAVQGLSRVFSNTTVQKHQFFGTQCFFIVQLTSIRQFSSVQSLGRVRLFVTPWITARQASLSITNSRSSFRLTSIESVMPSNHLFLCRPLLLLPLIPPSIRVFSNELTLHMRWPKYWFQL